MEDNQLKRLMVFTSFMRSYNLISHARILQALNLFKKFEKENPLKLGVVYNDGTIGKDHKLMKEFFKCMGE